MRASAVVKFLLGAVEFVLGGKYGATAPIRVEIGGIDPGRFIESLGNGVGFLLVGLGMTDEGREKRIVL